MTSAQTRLDHPCNNTLGIPRGGHPLAFSRGVARHNADPGPAARRLGLIAHFDGFADRYQSEDIAQFARRSADLTFDRVAAFMEM
jgi:hypothetical protein